MKNLSSIPRLSLFEAFTILITLAVCLAAFTEAEVRTNLRKQIDENYKLQEGAMGENIPSSLKTVKLRGSESEQPNAENKILDVSLEKLIKRQSDDFGESTDSENEKENDGYGYDDDEYYHLNYKRNEDSVGNLEGHKTNKGKLGESSKKEGIASSFGGSKLSGGKSQKESNEKETQTIEMLNFKEFHPNIGGEENQNPNQNPVQNAKPYAYENAHKKLPASSLDSLNMRDLKDNSAIDEKLKKEEGTGVLTAASSESKVTDGKKSIKAEDKDVKLKDAKMTDDSEKKEKETSLKDVKENVASKNLKDSAKNSDEKEKNLKLSDSAKLEDNLEKLNSKNKDGETAKIAKEDKDNSKLFEKEDVDVINPNEISQINNRASFVSNDYKDNLEAMKPVEGEDEEKDMENLSEGEKSLGLSDYEDLRERQEKLRERHLANSESSQGSDQGTRSESQESRKENDFFSFPANFDSENDYFKKRASWKDHGKFHFPEPVNSQIQMEQMPTQEQQQQQQQMAYDHEIKNSYHLKFPPSELENTEYHKNFLKSLKRYKNLNENVKVLNPDMPTSSNTVEKSTSFQTSEEILKKKRSKPKKRRSMLLGDENKSETPHSKLRRHAYRSEKTWCPTKQEDSQLSSMKTEKDDSKLFDNKKYDGQQETSRQRRKSPSKLEYEIKIINQNQQDSRNAPFSSLRMKKDVKIKLATDDKYLKKYPYSQVNRDDLTGFELEKKYKRKAPVWMKKDKSKDSVIQTRGLPSGYYGNRVKFGQKSYARTEEKSNSDQSTSDVNKITYVQMPLEKTSSFQRTWELKPQDYKHDPMKRYDASNSLLLIKKGQNGERIAKAFEEGGSKDQDETVDTEHLAKLLSKDNDYLILKKTDTNKYRKVTNPEEGLKQEESGSSLQTKKDALDSEDKLSAKNKGVHARSSHKEERKYSSSLHGASAKSNLKKTFEKFRDFADFFKDSESEASDNQFQSQELKEGRDIVFSEDKLPDPIVISSDSTKTDGFSQKPTNSIYSISNNFKHLDQQDRKEEERKENDINKNMFTAEVKSTDGQEFSWEPALKNAFPEAKSINAMSKNGNEIIVLDFNRNQLKNEHGYFPISKANGKSQPASGMNPGSRLLDSVGQRQVEVVLPSKLFDKNRDQEKSASGFSNGPYAVFNGADGQTQVTIPIDQLNQLAQIPGVFQTFLSKKQNTLETKSRKKKSVRAPEDSGSENYNQFLRDLRELSEINKKGKAAVKRNSKEILLPASSFPELTGYSGVNVRNLGSLLANILTNQNVEKQAESLKPSYSKSEQWYPASYDVRRQNQWSSEVKNNEHSGIKSKEDTFQAEVKEEIEKVLQSDGENKNYQEDMGEELAAASGRTQRLRREGMRKARKTMENALSFGDSQKEVDKCPVQAENKCVIKPGSDASNSKETDDTKPKEEDESKESTDDSKLLKSDYEDHLSELFENLSSNKNQKEQLNVPNESTPNRGKRKDIDRRKRSSRRNVKNNVSTTEVQNRILKNLPEDNYQSVYSPGIKRRLLSTKNDEEDADGYNGADEHDRSKTAEGDRAKCANNARNKCVDPIILELFGAEGATGEKNRDRRSLTSGFHSNFKREIDLDESMPNDFQNFLVTSLGGFGSQKREVVKKDEALWDGRDTSQENYNQIVESSSGGKDVSEDSALEKREVSSGDNHKTQKYKSPNYFESQAESNKKMAPRSEKIIRSEDKSIGSKESEFEDKVPTQIRIQITNASGKEKKSSKPIMDESETTSTEMENLPKEKEFFDKNKVNQLGVGSLPKLHQFSKPKFSLYDYDDYDSGDDKQKPYAPRPYRWRRRKKKKYVPENPMKPVKDFIAFDQKAMEILLRKYMADQNLGNEQQATTQKAPLSNHLPQVETVYNPTQGTNKAQLDNSRITKMNSISNKNAENAKNSLQANDASVFDERVLRSYLKDKTNKVKTGKEFEDGDWKSYSEKMRLNTDNLGDNPGDLSFQNFGRDTASFSTNPSSTPAETQLFDPYTQGQYNKKWQQNPFNNYLYHAPNTNIMNSNSFYDALKLKQELKNLGFSKGFMMKDHSSSKSSQKPYYFSEGSPYNKVDDKDRNFNFPTSGEPLWNTYDYTFYKKPFAQNLKSSDFYSSPMKNQANTKSKANYPSTRSKFGKPIESEKLFDTPQSHGIDSTKDTDYLDPLEDDYPDDEVGKEPQFDEPLITDAIKKPSKIYDPSNLHHIYFYKNSDIEGDGAGDNDEEFDDEYDETADDDELDDYSLLANAREADLELPKNSYSVATLQGTNHPEDTLFHLSTLYPKSNQFEVKKSTFDQMEYNNPKPEEKFEAGGQNMPLEDLKSNIDSISSSTNILKTANENSNIFGKNLIKNLNKFNYDESWRKPEKLQDEHPSIDLYSKYGRKIKKRKMDWHKKLKRNKEHQKIGSRMFFVAKSEMYDKNANLKPKSFKVPGKRQNQYERIPLTVQFAAPDNDFEYESENKGKHINGIDDQEDVEEVQENLEDDGETLSEDNVLENIIGKYIMRRRIQSSPTEIFGKGKKLHKRSTHPETICKVLKKRLSSGHLTENNFKKFHKKNLLAKRQTVNTESTARHILKREEIPECIISEEGGGKCEGKRSALDLFKKITNKDKDTKKSESPEAHNAGFEPLLSLADKKNEIPSRTSDEASAPEAKKLTIQEKTEPKLHWAFEPMNMKGGLSERSKEKSKVSFSAADGPWKLDLNDRWDHPGWDSSLAEPNREKNNKDLKAYFVISKNEKRAMRKFQGALPTAGSSQIEVGNSYRPRFEDSKKHLRKRSLDDSKAREKGTHEDAAQPSPKKIAENLLAIQEHNRALHDTQSFSEGDSDPQAPHVLQSDSNINGSFVTDIYDNPRFLSKEKLTNLKSVFPTLSDANIIRDSRDINEGTSEYLSQRIVEAILTQVSANAKFKELIAPGLAKRTPVLKESIDEKRKTMHQMDFNEQLQSSLQKFMFDLQKIAEQHVRKRMCNEIDKQSKQFLQSLLNVPAGKKNKEYNSDTSCSISDDINTSTATPQATQPPSSAQQLPQMEEKMFSNLKKKQDLLKKLIGEYQNLSKLEQETLSVNYRYLLQELDLTNKELALSKGHSCLVSSFDVAERFWPWKSKDRKALKEEGYENIKNLTAWNQRRNSELERLKNQQQNPLFSSPSLPSYIFTPSEDQPSTPKTENRNTNFEVVNPINVSSKNNQSSSTTPASTSVSPYPSLFFFEPVESKTDTPPSTLIGSREPAAFENVQAVNSSKVKQQSVGPTLLIKELPMAVAFPVNSTPTPQTFDLLSLTSSSPPKDNSQESESVRIKQSVPKEKKLDDGNTWEFQKLQFPDYNSERKESALHTLNTGDAAGLQLSLKSHNPWISTLDVAKTFRSVPTNLQQSKESIADNEDAFPMLDFKHTRSLFAPKNEYTSSMKLYDKPVFPYRLDKKFYTQKSRPFSRIIELKAKAPQNFQVLPFQYFLRKYRINMKQQPPPTHGKDSRKLRGKKKKKKKKKRKIFAKWYRRKFANSRENDMKNTELPEQHLWLSLPAVVNRQKADSLVE